MKEFCYGKELMKIIRRIIKHPPRQGQQFGTQHLLVSYNHTSWTRQDKMFAMLKFKERTNATAFSHAFILTITLTCPSEVTESKRTQEVIIHEENAVSENKNVDKKVKSKSETELNNSDMNPDILSAGKNHCRNKETKQPENNDAHISDNSIINDIEQIFTNNEKRTRTTSISNSKNSPSKKCTASYAIKGSENRLNNLRSIKKRARDTTENEKLSADNEELYNLPEVRKAKMPKVSLECDPSTSNEQNDCIMDEIAIDSVNLPYQYLIEKEIEDAKNKPEPSRAFHSNKTNVYNDHEKQDHNEDREQTSLSPSKTNEVDIDVKVRKTSNTKPNKCERWKVKSIRTLPSNNNISRSSDITDLVMEGLMFTIKQGQDSIAVIEQKTKVEIDEVLENSEKVETKEGEKCLRNSSLLGLENLITMIDMPELPDKQKKHSVIIPENIADFNSCTDVRPFGQMKDKCLKNSKTHAEDAIDFKQQRYNTTEITDVQHSNAQSSSSIVMCNTFNEDSGDDFRLILDDYSNDENGKDLNIPSKTYENLSNLREGNKEEHTEENEDEEDIIPEILQDKIQPPLYFPKRPEHKRAFNLELDSDKDLLMDDLDTEEDGESSDDNSLVNGETNALSAQSDIVPHKLNTSKRESKVPRIISNEIITIDQMPPALQKALKEKLIMQSSSNQQTETALSNCKMLSTESVNEGHNMSQSEKKNETEICDKPDVASGSEKTSDSISASKAMTTKTDEFVIQNDSRLDFSECQVEKEESDVHNSPSKSKQIRSKSCDLMHDDDQSLLNIEKESNSTKTRCLRPKRKSSLALDNEKDDQIRVEMLKFIHDITRGAKVVVQRISTKNISRVIKKNSSLTTCLN